MVVFQHRPELLLLALDLHHEMGGEAVAGQPTTRLEAVLHAVEALVAAKKRLCPEHLFGIITLQQVGATLLPGSISSSPEALARHLRNLAPLPPPAAAADPAAADPAAAAAAAEPAVLPFDLGSLIAAASPAASRHPDHGLRVVLVYGRSHLPAPVLASCAGQGLALDCLYVHDKPSAANDVQQVYAVLESLVDGISLRGRHAAVIHEVSSSRLGRLLSHMAAMLSHPLQRPQQQQMRPPLDLAAAPLAPLPSDAANLASGVPIVSPSRQPAALLPGALSWAAAVAAKRPGTAGEAAPAAPAPTSAPAQVASAWARPLQAGGGEDAWADSTAGGGATASGSGADKGAWSEPWDAQSSQQQVQAGQAQAASSAPAAALSAAAGASSSGAAAGALVTGVPVQLVRGMPGASSSAGDGPGPAAPPLLQPRELADGMALGLAAGDPWEGAREGGGAAGAADGDLAGLDDLAVALMVAAQAEQEEALAAAAAAAGR